MIIFKLIFISCLIYSSSAALTLYNKMLHVKTDRYLSGDGKAHSSVLTVTNNELFLFEQLSPGETIIYAEPWNTTNNRFALDISGGCRLGGTVKRHALNKSKNQLWNIKDGIVYSACNPKWIVYVDNYGAQTVKNIDEVPENERKFKISQAYASQYGGFDDDAF